MLIPSASLPDSFRICRVPRCTRQIGVESSNHFRIEAPKPALHPSCFTKRPSFCEMPHSAFCSGLGRPMTVTSFMHEGLYLFQPCDPASPSKSSPYDYSSLPRLLLSLSSSHCLFSRGVFPVVDGAKTQSASFHGHNSHVRLNFLKFATNS
jgi:hypothetical protein